MRSNFVMEVNSLNRAISRARHSVAQFESELESAEDRGQRHALRSTLGGAKSYLSSLEERRQKILTDFPEAEKGNAGKEKKLDDYALSILKGEGK